jgi:hypothetical protein
MLHIHKLFIYNHYIPPIHVKITGYDAVYISHPCISNVLYMLFI